MTPLELAKLFHKEYEELAPRYGYETRKETREFDETSNNGRLMIAVCGVILATIKNEEGINQDKEYNIKEYNNPQLKEIASILNNILNCLQQKGILG